MFKHIIIALIVVGAVTSVPQIRSRVLPPLGKALGPTGQRLMTPMKRWQAKTDCDELVRELRQDNTAGRQIPPPNDFTVWARRELRNPEAGVDPWGSRYYLRPQRGQLSVGSPGPDLKKGTPDDIVVTVPWG
jgi:hypothetical protein